MFVLFYIFVRETFWFNFNKKKFLQNIFYKQKYGNYIGSWELQSQYNLTF